MDTLLKDITDWVIHRSKEYLELLEMLIKEESLLKKWLNNILLRITVKFNSWLAERTEGLNWKSNDIKQS